MNMDAKPQRPFRARTFRDENQPLVTLPGKTIHQRNKSSPALSTLAQATSLQPLPKRTAFADVSNTARAFGVVKDDSALANKTNVGLPKDRTDTKASAAALQRPAQRPISVSGIKGFFGLGPAAGTASNNTVLPEQRYVKAQDQPPLAHKLSMVLRDPSSLGAELSRAGEGDEHDSKDTSRKTPMLYVDQKSNPSDDIVKEEGPWIPGIEQLPSHHSTAQHSQQPSGYLPNLPNFSALNLHEAPSVPSNEKYESSVPPPLPKPAPMRPQERQPLSSISEAPVVQSKSSASSVKSGEVWEREAYQGYEAGDYTTARSLKTRGDLTTDPTTIILAPKPTASTQRELAAAEAFVKESPEAAELEEDEAWDTSMVAEYGDDIFCYMRTLEEQMRPNPCYMDDQTEVQWSMRSVLMDWLVQVHHRFGLLPETLFLCVNYIDRFLSCKVVSLGKLQLVGATAIFVAAKYEEINCPSVQEIVYMVDSGYTIDEILKAERFMLSMLQFELGWPGPMSFLRRISKGDDYDLETRTLAKYFLEITIMDERFVGCIPSFTAAGSHCLARLMLKKGFWSQKHVHYSGYTYSQLRPLLLTMLSCCEDAQRHHGAVFDKYSDKRFKRASFFVQGEVDQGFKLPPIPRTLTIGNWDLYSR